MYSLSTYLNDATLTIVALFSHLLISKQQQPKDFNASITLASPTFAIVITIATSSSYCT
jgi:hypothetical protein